MKSGIWQKLQISINFGTYSQLIVKPMISSDLSLRNNICDMDSDPRVHIEIEATDKKRSGPFRLE